MHGEGMTSSRRQLVLVGGGHTHALLLNRLVEEPLEGVDITLVSDVRDAPYSGMLPGHVAGFYSHREMHIDLPRVCEAVGAKFVAGKVVAMDPESRILRTDSGEVLDFSPDLLSINVGSHPKVSSVSGASEYAIPSKPVPELLEGWSRVKEECRESERTIVVVGGGAGGVELTIAMQSQVPERTKFVLVHSHERLLEWHNDRVARQLTGVLRKRGVDLRLGDRVTEVQEKSVVLREGGKLNADSVFWVTQPAPPEWLSESGLDLTEKGFIRVKPTLQTVKHPWIFAAGDVATIESDPLPKSGVYAVRMAVPLERNVRAFFSGEELSDYDPQRKTLALIGTADGKAVASYGPFSWYSRGMWLWKDRIDRKFMEQFCR